MKAMALLMPLTYVKYKSAAASTVYISANMYTVVSFDKISAGGVFFCCFTTRSIEYLPFFNVIQIK